MCEFVFFRGVSALSIVILTPKHFVQITPRALVLKSPKPRAASVSHLISSLPRSGNVSPLGPWGTGGGASPGAAERREGSRAPCDRDLHTVVTATFLPTVKTLALIL